MENVTVNWNLIQVQQGRWLAGSQSRWLSRFKFFTKKPIQVFAYDVIQRKFPVRFYATSLYLYNFPKSDYQLFVTLLLVGTQKPIICTSAWAVWGSIWSLDWLFLGCKKAKRQRKRSPYSRPGRGTPNLMGSSTFNKKWKLTIDNEKTV